MSERDENPRFVRTSRYFHTGLIEGVPAPLAHLVGVEINTADFDQIIENYEAGINDQPRLYHRLTRLLVDLEAIGDHPINTSAIKADLRILLRIVEENKDDVVEMAKYPLDPRRI